MNPLSIVHTESSLGWGGQEIRILTEAAGLIRRGHRVELLCPAEARIHVEAARFGVPVHALPIGRKRMRGLAAMIGWFRDHRCDVINTHSSTDSWLAALAMLMLGKPAPVVRTRHISAPVPQNRMTRWLYGRAAAKIVTTGEVLRRQLIEDNAIAAEQIESVPTGIDTTRFVPGDRLAARTQLGLPLDMTLIGIVATLRSWKGHRTLIEACAGLAPNSGLVIVGDGPQREALQAMIGELRMQGRLWMPGNQTDVVPWLQAFDVFALPSYANEGVPQALVQAMLTALPCVSTSAGGIGELAMDEKTALLVPVHDAPALRAAITRLVGDAQLCARLGSTARAYCLERFSLERMLDRMETIFQTVSGDGFKKT
ncbi:MAG: glycosyltransferase family 1 protein [Betaproteobacteria bacterium]|nr:glycosyltransferase family 1 protein [Betaproteobacteria bacterium]